MTSTVPSGYNGVGFNSSIDYQELLPYLIQSLYYDPTDQTAAQTGLLTIPPSQTQLSINTYLTTYFTQPTNLIKSFPSTLESFINQFRLANGITTEVDLSDPSSDPIYNGFYTEFINVLKLPGDIPGSTTQQDIELFLQAFSNFLTTYNFPSSRSFAQIPDPNLGVLSTPNPNGVPYFINQWHDYLTRTALVTSNDDHSPNVIQAQYKTVFDAYFGAGSSSGTAFTNQVGLFINKEVDDNGFFVPSQSYGEWLKYVQELYTKSLAGSGSTIVTTVGQASHSDGPMVINRILFLLITLLNTVQQVAASQAQRLSFLTSWQRAYTDLLGQIRSFVKNGPEGLDNDEVISKQLNPPNQQYTTIIQARQQAVSDDSKAMQSTVQGSQDIAQQQASMITSFIQEISSILAVIFK